jgi:hypothetical protein
MSDVVYHDGFKGWALPNGHAASFLHDVGLGEQGESVIA